LLQPACRREIEGIVSKRLPRSILSFKYQLICRKGITHRDLKPYNVILTKSGTKLFDFGLTKLWPTSKTGTRPLR
jgi:serine/threonine protein kinase